MLDNLNTGYEGKFDFPPRAQAPERTYLLASVPRAGSTYFSHLLWRTGCLGAPLEYLNFEVAGPYGFAANSAALQQDLWRSVLRRRCSPNGIFGLKAFPQQLEDLQDKNAPLLDDVLATMLPRDRARRIVYLRRRDRVAQTVSYARALLSGIWRKDQEKRENEPLRYSQNALDAAERSIEFQEGVWAKMFDELRIDPLNLWHEDILEDPEAATRQVADYIGIQLDQDHAVAVPEIAKQSAGDAGDWAARFAKSRANSR